MRWGFGLVAALALLVSSVDTASVMAGEVAAKPVEALTYDAACCVLKDLGPGEHQVTIIHPYTCCPVTVCFCLPCGCYCLECDCGLCAKKLRFKYPGLFNDVVIKFHKGGGVTVKD